MNSNGQADYVAKAGRRVLITTGICTLPALVLLAFGIIEHQRPPNYAQDPDPELKVTIPLFLAIASAVVSFVAATMVAVAYYFFAKKKYRAVLASLLVSLVASVVFILFAFPSVQNPVLEARAKAGSLQAQHDLGERYLHGIHISKDTAKGVYWLTRAAEGGHLEAQLSLGDHYLINGDREKARVWIERLANSKVDGWERLNAQMRLQLVRDAGVPVTRDVLISGRVFGTLTRTDADFPWMRGTFARGAAFSEYESFVVPMEWDPEGEHLDLMALEASGVPLSQVQWGTPDENGPTYLHALHLYNARVQAGWRFGPKPISFKDD